MLKRLLSAFARRLALPLIAWTTIGLAFNVVVCAFGNTRLILPFGPEALAPGPDPKWTVAIGENWFLTTAFSATRPPQNSQTFRLEDVDAPKPYCPAWAVCAQMQAGESPRGTLYTDTRVGWPFRCLQMRAAQNQGVVTITSTHLDWPASMPRNRVYTSVVPLGFVWTGIFGNGAMLLVGFHAVRLATLGVKRLLRIVLHANRRTRGLCPNCSYPIGVSGSCPECGSQTAKLHSGQIGGNQ